MEFKNIDCCINYMEWEQMTKEGEAGIMARQEFKELLRLAEIGEALQLAFEKEKDDCILANMAGTEDLLEWYKSQ